MSNILSPKVFAPEDWAGVAGKGGEVWLLVVFSDCKGKSGEEVVLTGGDRAPD